MRWKSHVRCGSGEKLEIESKTYLSTSLGGAQGQATEIEIAARHILKTRDRLNRILSEATGQPIEVIEKDTDRDNFMDAQEAKEYGLIDHIMESAKSLKK